jgi:hypothetical protein
MASCSRRSGCGCAPSTTSRCWPRSAPATGSRTTAATSTARPPGQAPYTLARLLPRRLAARVDESHVSVPQLHGQFAGDRSRKETSSSTASACPRRWTTGRFASRSSRAHQPVHLHVGDAVALRDGRLDAGRRADRPADRAARPRGRRQADEEPDRRPDRRDRHTSSNAASGCSSRR